MGIAVAAETSADQPTDVIAQYMIFLAIGRSAASVGQLIGFDQLSVAEYSTLERSFHALGEEWPTAMMGHDDIAMMDSDSTFDELFQPHVHARAEAIFRMGTNRLQLAIELARGINDGR